MHKRCKNYVPALRSRTIVAIRSQVYRNNIPSKKEHGQILYSKLHFDLSKTSEQQADESYYTVQEAMKKFKLSRDSVYNLLHFHEIQRVKSDRFVKFLKVDFNRIMGGNVKNHIYTLRV